MWTIETRTASAAQLHARDVPEGSGAQLWQLIADRPALVLGSAQPEAHVDTAACAAAGIDVARRRSGGGAVLLVPGEALWLDVIIPADHAVWSDDVVRASWWLGDAWGDALCDLGIRGATVRHGALDAGPWGRQVCFAGQGSGEVLLDGRKLVGISQRRTRTHARFQCIVHRAWQPELLHDLLAEPRPSVAELAAMTATVEASDAALVGALRSRLP